MSEPTTEAPTTVTEAAPALPTKPAPVNAAVADDEDSEDEPTADADDAEEDGDDAEPGLAYLYDNDVRPLPSLGVSRAQKLPSDDEDEADFVAGAEEPDLDEPEDEVRRVGPERADRPGRRRRA